MSWFEEQLQQRRENDDTDFEEALSSVAGAVMGKRLASAFSSREVAESAIDEILKYYHCHGKNVPLPTTLQTVDEQIEYRMRPFGIMRRSVKLDTDWYKHAVGAMLGTVKEDGRAVALLPGRLSGYTYYDFASGERVRINRKNQAMFDEDAICFYQPLPPAKLSVKDLLVFMAHTYSVSDLVMYVGMMGIVSAVGLLSPLLTKWLFNDVLTSGSMQMLAAIAVFMVCYAVSRVLINAYQLLINSRISIKQSISVQSAVMGRIMSLPPAFFKNYASGELGQYASAVQNLCVTMMSAVGNVGLTSLFSLIYIGQIFTFAPALVAPSVLITLATVIVSTLATFVQMDSSRKQMQISAKTGGLTYATIRGIPKIKLAGAEKRMFARWANHYAKEAELLYNPPLFVKISGVITTAITLAGTMLLYYLAVKNHVGVANYYAFNASYGQISGAFTALASLTTTIATIRPTLEIARPIMEAEPEVAEGKHVVTELRGGIEISNVSFRYSEDMPYVIDNLSLKIHAGEYLAVVGSTGCGKSTLMRLLLGFETPQKGAIYYDRNDISRVDLKSLRRKIGTVMQDGKLFLGDIFSNIVISAPQLTLSEAWEAAEIAAIAEDIRELPMGMHTVISEGQGGISGGQKQRLMIARAVASKPKILMFDEATSALDNVTQKKVSDAIDSLRCTRIVIAHRLSTIRHADRIIYLDHGKIAEEGTYEELIEKNGLFAELVKRQRIDMEAE